MRVLGIDLGERRIGLAVSDEEARIAFPAGSLDRKNRRTDLAALVALVRERAIGRAVVGLPLHMSGRAGPEAEAARRFASALGEAAGIPVDTLDERWTSVAAERSLAEGRRRTVERRGKGVVDEVAATLLLSTYLERIQRTEPT
ncbi:MAG: Holliday junction resolvase RuvX [Proteobacteria bacterium]|nr:MAG: Holliday junction resolvase RuvX [Pseudomonadota bacterium]